MLSKDDIITLPHPSLRQKSARISTISDEDRSLIADMKRATLDWEMTRPHEIGAALAAVQVNYLKRIIIVRSDFEDKESANFVTLINPEVIKYDGEVVYDYEGCLSVKDTYGTVPRYSKVRIRALDEDGNDIRIKAEGFLARVLQHEIDHTNGILFIDHIKDTPNAFYKLNDEGELVPLDYENHIKQSSILW